MEWSQLRTPWRRIGCLQKWDTDTRLVCLFCLHWTMLASTISNWFTEGCFGHWAFGHTELTAMICLSEHQTIASQCAFSSDQRILSWISYKLIVLIPMKPFFTATQISHYKYRYGSSSGDYEHRRLAWAVSLCPWICCTSLFFIWEKGNQVLISMPSDQGYSYLKFGHLQRLKRLMMQIRYKKGSRWSQSPTLFVLFVWSRKCNDYKIQFFYY